MTVLGNIRTFFQGGAAPVAPVAARAADAVAEPLAAVGAIRPDALEIGLTKGSLNEVSSFFGSAERSLSGELFRLQQFTVGSAINESAARGVQQRWLMDPEGAAAVQTVLPAGAVKSAAYAAMPFKNHSKMFVADGDRALMTTGAFVDKTGSRVELVATFRGDAARAAEELIDAGMEGAAPRLRAAAYRAAPYGIVVNEPVAGVQHLTRGVHDMIEAARDRIVVSTKIFSDAGVRKAVRAAEARGVQVRFTDIRANDMHANLLIADDSMYVGTAHFSPRGMGDMTRAYRRSRESGLIVHDKAQATRMLEHLDAQLMDVYTPEQFERSRVAFAKMDAFYKLQEQDVDAAKLAAAQLDYDEGLFAWHAIRQEVSAARAADGMTFTNPAGF